MRRVWTGYFPNDRLELTLVKDAVIAADWQGQFSISAETVAIATLIAMTIAACGAYVLAADAVQRRTGEIAMHKLFGARRSDIGKLIAHEIGSTVLLGAAIGLPLAALAIARYMATYVEHTSLAFWALAFAPLGALAVVAAAAARHAWIAMELKPAAALRDSEPEPCTIYGVEPTLRTIV